MRTEYVLWNAGGNTLKAVQNGLLCNNVQVVIIK